MSHHKVVIVEDERIVAVALEEQLKRHGYDVVGNVGSGEEATEVIRDTSPHVVLMDIKLAGELDGIETAERIAEFSNAGVVFLTAYSDEGLIRRAREAKPYGYLLKPVADRALRPAIEMALSRRAADIRQAEEVVVSIDNAIEELKPVIHRLSLVRHAPVVCKVCHRARTRTGEWQDLATELQERLDFEFPMVICDACDDSSGVAASTSGLEDDG